MITEDQIKEFLLQKLEEFREKTGTPHNIHSITLRTDDFSGGKPRVIAEAYSPQTGTKTGSSADEAIGQVISHIARDIAFRSEVEGRVA